jgi:hypothetical protein
VCCQKCNWGSHPDSPVQPHTSVPRFKIKKISTYHLLIDPPNPLHPLPKTLQLLPKPPQPLNRLFLLLSI